MRFRHLLRDVFFLSLPFAALAAFLTFSVAATFYNGEIRAFHGYVADHTSRVGTLRSMLKGTAGPLLHLAETRNYLDPKRPPDEPGVRLFDLRLKSRHLDALDSDLIESGKIWKPGILAEPGGDVEVKVHYRGQGLRAFFWSQKTWRIKTPKDGLVDGVRLINLSRLQHRLQSHLTFLAAAKAGAWAPRSSIAHLYLNLQDQGYYLLEESIDESMVRRYDVMPGDVFNGELYPPEEAKASANELYWNPYLWTKSDRNNRFSTEHRPYLGELFDHVCDPDPGSFDRMYRLMDVDRWAEYVALLSFVGDQRVDNEHNHKLYFNPTSGKFVPIVWDPLFDLRGPDAVETTTDRMFRKLARDPRFLDRVQRFIHDRLLAVDATGLMIAEIDRLERELGPRPVRHVGEVLDAFRQFRPVVAARGENLRRLDGVADVRYASEAVAEGTALSVSARALASLRLTGITLAGAGDVQLFEDRDGDRRLGPADRELAVERSGSQLRIAADDALVHVGRDFTATYRLAPGEDPELLYESKTRHYTRLAYLESRYLLRPRSAGPAPAITGLELERTVGQGPVDVRPGPPDGYLATETVHPWTLPAAPAPRIYDFSGEVALDENLVVGESDSFAAAPGTRLRLGPGVSLVLHSRVHLDRVEVERLDPDHPWGVVALQGPATSGSVIENCRFSGGSEATVDYLYYSGMLSFRYSDRTVLRHTLVDRNMIGDDSVHFAKCHDVLLDHVRVENALGDAIDMDLSSGKVLDTVILKPQNDGLDLMTAHMRIERLRVEGANDKGISSGEDSTPEIVDSRLIGCVTGIASKDRSEPLVRNTEIRDCKVGVAGYAKNWRYGGGGRGRLEDCVLSGNGKDVRLDAGSRLVLERCATEGKFDLPSDLPPGAFQNLNPRPAAASAAR